MSKENFINKSTLMFISSALLLALFCTMGMSFTPVETEEETIVEQNDTIVVTKEIRRAHAAGSCGDPDTKELDYGRGVAQTQGNGKVYVSTSGTTQTGSSWSGTGTGNKSTYDWNCGESDATSGTAANHQKTMYWWAEANEGYYFAGWSTSTSEGGIFTQLNPYEYTQRMEDEKYNASSTTYTSSNPLTTTYYAIFKEKVKATITMPATTHGTYTYSCADGSGTVNTTSSTSVKTDNEITFVATPASGYKFFGWYTLNGSSEDYKSYSSTFSVTFGENTTIYAKFIPSNTALFIVKGNTAVQYYDLNAAATAAVSSSSKVVVPIANGTVPAGNYTIPSGVTLLVPFDDANTLYTTEPTWPKQAPSGQSAYRKLTLKSGVNVVVNGSISVSAQSQGNQPYGGCVYGKYGQIDMEANSTITINSSANLYCWGYITGSGAITAKSGAKVYEDFQLTCWRGGTASRTLNNNASSKGVFPLAQYYIQNIEAPLTMEAGAHEYTCTAITASGSVWDAPVEIVGTNSGLFQISSGSVRKWYDSTKDRQMYSVNGNAKLGAVVVDVVITISSSTFVLPITNNMDITIASGTLTCDQRVALLPGARIVIDEGATVKFDSGSKLFIYDKDEWKGSYNGSMVSYNYPGNATHLPAPYSPTCSSIKTLRTFDKMDDAELDVNGTLEMTGALYTTIHGANVRSSNGTGIIKYKSSAGTESVTYQAFQGGSGGTEITWQNISITPAKLHNASQWYSAPYTSDAKACEYLATDGTAANTTITYADGHWGWMEIWTDESNNVLYASNTLAKMDNASAKTCPTKTGYNGSWTTTSNATTDGLQKVLHKASYVAQEYTITYLDKDGAAFSGVHGSGYPTKHTYGTATNLVNPTKEGYNFSGWFTASTCTGSAVTSLGATAYTAGITLYAKWTVITCTITWKVDGQSDETTEVALGQAPVYPHETPGKAQTNQNTFTFEGWSDGKTKYGKDATLPSVTGPATYTAQFMDHIRYYTITWKDWDGTELEKDEGEKGKMQWGAQPSYDGGVPTRDGDDVRSYSFKGWYPEITAETKVSGDQEYTAQYNMDIKAKTAEPVAVTSDETARITTVAESGKLNVGAHLTTEDLILEATPSTSGEITGGGTITATRTFFDLSNGTEGFKARTWYAVAVPWGVIVPYSAEGSYGGVYLKIGDEYERQQLGKTYDLIYYDGESRAKGKDKAWRYVEDDQKEHKTHDVMEPGRAYMIYLTEDAEVIRFQKHSDSPFNTPGVEVKKHVSSNTDYKSWNGIANPATYHADLKNVGVTYGQVYIDPIKKRYDTFDMSKKLVVGQPVFVQVPDETFKSYGTEAVKATISVSAPSLVRRRAKEQVSLTCYELMLAASDADVTDRVIVRMDEEKTENEYVIGKDLVKMGVSDLVPQMWINRYEKKMCVNTEAGYANTADYPLSIFAPKDGEYDLFIDDQPNNETMLYLTYDGEAIWNLSYGGYVASLEKGTNTHYGLRIVKKAPQITTGIEETTVQNGEAVRKVLVNDKVYIIRNGEIYSVTGQKAK